MNDTIGILARAIRRFDAFTFVQHLVSGTLTSRFAHETGHAQVFVLVRLTSARARLTINILHV